MAPPPSRPGRDDVCVWYVDTAALFKLPARIATAEATLEPAELERYRGYRHDADRLMFLAGRMMARAGRRDYAIEFLDRAVTQGYANYPLIRRDESFARLRDDPSYQSIERRAG